jgi:hypothetical protein
LSEVEDTIQPSVADRRLFVVDERIVSAAQTSGRRSVLAYAGTNGGESLQGNVMLSVSFGPAGIRDDTDIEAWGWDNHRQRYNYYKLDDVGSQHGELIWKFRASSERAEFLSPTERRGTCLACHASGAPVMKELFFPWNNWHAGVGGSFKAEYLDPAGLTPAKWPAAATPRFRQLTGADKLEEDFLFAAFKRFNLSRLNSALKRDDATGNRAINAAGQMTVLEGRRLLKSLFETTELNLYSSRNTTGIHPFGQPGDFVAGAAIRLPADQFFLNSDLIAGGGEGGLRGLQISSARGFAPFATLSQQENRDLVQKFQLRLNSVSGDTNFAWFVPGPAYIDNDLIDKCLQLGVVTPHFLAAALAVDLENPVFSARRGELLTLLPDQFDFTPVADGTDPLSLPRNAAGDLLTSAVLGRIDMLNPAANSAADEFRTLLKSNDAVPQLSQRASAYVARVKTELDTAPANANRRKAELERLWKLMMARRQALAAHPVFRNLDETGGQLLFPRSSSPP